MPAVARLISDCYSLDRRDRLSDFMVRSMPGLLAVMRARRDELQITHQTIDSIAGWPEGYCGKLLAPEPIKNLGWSSLGLGLGALGMALVAVEDPEQIARIRSRLTPRERPFRTPLYNSNMPQAGR